MFITRYICVVLSLFFICACTPGKEDRTPLGSPPPMEEKKPTTYEKLSSSLPNRPQWIDTLPDDANGVHFMVGLSNAHPSEKEAREDAMRHAREQYAKYTGVDVSQVDAVFKALHGLESGVKDAMVTQASTARHSSDARVSRIKAKQWYSERHRAYVGDTYSGDVYRCWVLGTVPDDEYDRVQQWKQLRADQEAEQKKALALRAKQALDRILEQDRAQMARVDTLLDEGDVIACLERAQGEWNHLHSQIDAFAQKGGAYLDYIPKLESAQGEWIQKIVQVRSQVQIDTGRFGSLSLEEQSDLTLLPVWIWGKKGGRRVPHFPVQFQDETGKIWARAVSDGAGKAVLSFSPEQMPPPGRYHLTPNVTQGDLSPLHPAIKTVLSRIQSTLILRSPESGVRGVARAAVQSLFNGPKQSRLPVASVRLGAITYGETGQNSVFSQRFTDALLHYLTGVEQLLVVSSRVRRVGDINTFVASYGAGEKKSRGIKLKLGDSAVQAALDEAESAIDGQYTLTDTGVQINLNLRRAGSGVLLRSAMVSVDKSQLVGISLYPIQAAPSPDLLPDSQQTIAIDISSHGGDGQVYEEGDLISYFLSTDQDAYLLLIYEHAARQLIQILPNGKREQQLYPGGKYFKIPENRDDFQFEIAPPFGVERVWAFASSQPLPQLGGRMVETGLLLLDGTLPEILDQLRRHGRQPGVFYGESRTQITTIAKDMNL